MRKPSWRFNLILMIVLLLSVSLVFQLFYVIPLIQSARAHVVRANGFDVIFIDIRMPVMNGLEVYLAMKEIKPDVKAVMMTGFRREVGDLVDQAISGSAYMCLDKPIDLNVLLKVVEAVATGRSKAEVQDIIVHH